jgi:hypothetical protein
VRFRQLPLVQRHRPRTSVVGQLWPSSRRARHLARRAKEPSASHRWEVLPPALSPEPCCVSFTERSLARPAARGPVLLGLQGPARQQQCRAATVTGRAFARRGVFSLTGCHVTDGTSTVVK